MKFHCVLLDLGHGFCNSKGEYDRGYSTGWTSEVDLIDSFGKSFLEGIESESVRVELLPTRKPPGIRDDARFTDPFDGKLCISIHMSNSEDGNVNGARISYSVPQGKEIAGMIEEELLRWAKGQTPWYAKIGTNHDKSLPQDKLVIKIEPLNMIAANAKELAPALPQAGQSVGQIVGRWMKEQSVHAGIRPRTLFDRPWIKQA